MIVRFIMLMSLLLPFPANASCFLFFCSPMHYYNHHHKRKVIVIKKKVIIIKKVIVEKYHQPLVW